MLGKSWPWSKFQRWEFECKCGCMFDTVDAELIQILLDIKKHFDCVKVIINSGCRCSKHNTLIDGAIDSQHMLGRAADITVEGIKPVEVYGYLTSRYLGKFGIGLYKTFVHIDTRSGPSARW